MTFHFSLNSFITRLATILLGLAIFAALSLGAVWTLGLGTLTDDRIEIPRDVLVAGVQYFPTSPRLQARLATVEMQGMERDLNKAEAHIRRAIELLPGEYSYHMTLASILEAQGKRDSAEKSYRNAVALAPYYLEVHWRLANNLVRQGKINESLEHFRYAAEKNLGLLPNAYDLLWTLSNGDIQSLKNVTSDAPKAQLMLANFLINQSKFLEAGTIYRGFEPKVLRAEAETSTVINALVTANQMSFARELWGKAVNDDSNNPQPLVWNGSFENEINPALRQFDWDFKDNEFVRVMIDAQTAHSGGRALRLTFLGKDTVRIDGEIKQLVLVKPGKKYRLEYQYKTRDLITPMGPRVVVADATAPTVLAGSEAVPEGTNAWQQVGVDFVAPANASVVLIKVQRIPKYSYDDPSRGVIWFDDFVLKEY